jgi:hypothetical protein
MGDYLKGDLTLKRARVIQRPQNWPHLRKYYSLASLHYPLLHKETNNKLGKPQMSFDQDRF